MNSVQQVADDAVESIVVVSVGTDHHRFDRLIRWIDIWAALHPQVLVFAQRGSATAPTVAESDEIVPHGELLQMFAGASVVVSHAGPSTVMDARASGRLPIVVPRDPEFGEHVDGHQIRFAAHLERHGLARMARTESEFRRLLDTAIENPGDFHVDRTDDDAPSGVVQFGSVIDGLLGVSTPIDSGLR